MIIYKKLKTINNNLFPSKENILALNNSNKTTGCFKWRE